MSPRTKSLFEQLIETVGAALPENLTEDVRKNIKASVQSACERMDLVTREELEVQEEVLRRTREKVDQLEAHISELEKKFLKNHED